MNDVRSEEKAMVPAVTILRISLAVVFIVFGIWKARLPMAWVIFMPNWVAGAVGGFESLDALGVLRLMGFAEAVLGLQLLLGFFTKATAVVCTVLLAGIIFHVGLDQIGIRDLGLLGATTALCFAGGGPLSLDHWFETRLTATER